MKIIKLMELETQRNTIYVNVTDSIDSIDFTILWIKASQKRYIKLKGFHDTDTEGLKEFKEKIKEYPSIKYFNNIKDFLKW